MELNIFCFAKSVKVVAILSLLAVVVIPLEIIWLKKNAVVVP